MLPLTRCGVLLPAKMPKICSLYAWNDGSLASDLLVSIHPKHVEQIFSGKKRYELRRNFLPSG